MTRSRSGYLFVALGLLLVAIGTGAFVFGGASFLGMALFALPGLALCVLGARRLRA